MKANNQSHAPGIILPVRRSKEQAKRFYDRISKVYDYLVGMFERKYVEMAVEQLSVEESETVLEVGFGTGHCLKRMAESVGEMGKVYGVDIIGCDITQSFVIAPVVVVFDEGPDGFLQLARHLMGHLVNFAFYGAMVSFNLAVSLGIKG